MRKLLSILIIAVVSAVSAFAAGPEIVFKEKKHDFGTIKEANGPVSVEFKFTNEGDKPLAIVSATSSCGCTTPTYPKQPIAPGKEGVIKVTYNPAGRPGEFIKDITVKTNDKKNKRLKLKLTGTVIPKSSK